jgi:NAD(P)-dependent dehydrogenase (short-subunit alcohol dehydrogenase family)
MIEVLAGVDLGGKRILVTGVSAGLGVETARALAAHGAQVVGAARDLEKARRATEPVVAQAAHGGGLELVELDLASLASVRASADTLVADGRKFDIVIANAGVMACPKGETADADVDLEDPNFEHTPYAEFVAYGRSKTANVLFAVEFDRRHRGAGIRATAVHPGGIQTELGRYMTQEVRDALMASVTANQPEGAPAFSWKTIPQGAATSVWAGVVAPADAVGAHFCEDCHVAEIVDDPGLRAGVRAYALDPEHAKALWAKSEEMVGERF